MAGIGVVINSRARGNRRRPDREAKFAALLGDDGEVVSTRDLVQLEVELRRFHRKGIDVLAVCGGDGSIYHALTIAIAIWGAERLPPLLPLRGGTINNVSRTIGARRHRPESMLSCVVENYRLGRSHRLTHRELIRVNGSDYGYIVGAGAVVTFLKLYYDADRPGPLSALALLVRCGLSWIFHTALIEKVMQPFGAEVECDGERVPFRSFTVLLASSVAHIGLGVKPFYLSGRTRERYHLIAGPSTAGQLLGRLWWFFRGLPSGLETLYDSQAQRVSVRFDSPQAVTINGEILPPAAALELEPGPRVTFICG